MPEAREPGEAGEPGGPEEPGKPGRSGGGSAADAPPALRWHVRIDGPASGADNMAMDDALARAIESGRPEGRAVLRLYRWARPTISFGRNQPARGLFDTAEAARREVDFVRRPTGGRAVLHHDELTYAVIVPVDAFGGLRPSYRVINRALVAGLRTLGIAAELATPAGRALPPDAGPCFREPAGGEVVAGPRPDLAPAARTPGQRHELLGRSGRTRHELPPPKLAGSAQLRIGRTLLQHGSLPLSRSQSLLEALTLPVSGALQPRKGEEHRPRAEAAWAGAMNHEAAQRVDGNGKGGLERILGRDVPWDAAADAILSGFRETLPGDWVSAGVLAPQPVVVERLRSHYASSGWTWRA